MLTRLQIYNSRYLINLQQLYWLEYNQPFFSVSAFSFSRCLFGLKIFAIPLSKPSLIAPFNTRILLSSSSNQQSPALITSLAFLNLLSEMLFSTKFSKWIPDDIEVFWPTTENLFKVTQDW